MLYLYLDTLYNQTFLIYDERNNNTKQTDLEIAIISTMGSKTLKKFINYMKLEFPIIFATEIMNYEKAKSYCLKFY